ncbi:hypothetical protein BJ138DRAFT_1177497 [Hygrophoropsis aurantiaca]|uniref:Uncharacterized protein n=1 Tax=Hygrophoropsis aurantiaca TaxID=72124 RepID=A0ACB8ANU7_9AGAM|nr:hypothetical protein BJ138DRAFT_1177497 [Hygrophoropsis aurantiaca]
MSIYPQAHSYGQAAYPAPGYPQPGPPTYSYQQSTAPPPSTYYVDPHSFRRDYAARLAQLTINSRPIIQSLSMVAQEYSRWAEIVVQCLEAHIRRVPPYMKLPSFYLLDAISKNVYDPYARHFAPFVVPLFLETYQQVDQTTRSKMEEMLLTWRTGAPSGKELFGFITQIAIERGVWGGDRGAADISKAQVLSELEFTLSQKERALQANTWDHEARKHVEVLQQLRSLVEAGVSQDELRQILSQLRSLSQSTAPPTTSSQPQVSYPQPSSTYQYPSQPVYPARTSFVPPAVQHSESINSSYHYQSTDQPKSEPLDLSALLSTSVSSGPSTSTSAAPPSNIAGLFSALLKAGIVSATGTPVGDSSSAKAEGSTPQPSDEPSENEREASRSYRRAILAETIKLTNADITKKRPAIVRFMYERLSVQCKQCGVRFSDDVMGRKDMESHLDMHFRQNRKANQNLGRGHSRSWFVALEDWVHDTSTDYKGKGRADGVRPLNAKASALAEAANREAELRAQFVIVPPGDEAKTISCPICKEILKSEFLEDDEEWVWKNAVKKDDRIFHATCHSEALTSVQSLAVRLRNETTGRSRSGTPEGISSRASPPKETASLRTSLSPTAESKRAALKRKAENDDPSFHMTATFDNDGTPPMKRLALEA